MTEKKFDGTNGDAHADVDAVNLLLHVQRLIDVAMSGQDGGSLSYVSSRTAVVDLMRAMLESARQEIRCVISTPFFAQELVNLLNSGASFTLLSQIRADVLIDSATASSEVGASVLRCDAVETRVTRWSMPDLLLVDGEQGFSRLPDGDREALVIRGPGLMQLLDSFCAGAWSFAWDLELYKKFAKLHDNTQIRHILVKLSQGHTDDVAARQLGMSVRTYRRHVADLMRGLDVKSRFQVGVRAAQLGLTG